MEPEVAAVYKDIYNKKLIRMVALPIAILVNLVSGKVIENCTDCIVLEANRGHSHRKGKALTVVPLFSPLVT